MDLLDRIIFTPRREPFRRIVVILILVFGIVLVGRAWLPEIHLPEIHLPEDSISPAVG